MDIPLPLPQSQSRLFKLPRELRESIYESYMHQPNGLSYDSRSDKLRCATFGQSALCLALMYTCKLAASELSGRARGIALRVNTVTFVSDDVGEAELGHHGIHSRAARYWFLRMSVNLYRALILIKSVPYLPPSILDEVTDQYPTVAAYFRAPLRRQDLEWGPPQVYSKNFIELPVDLCRAIHYALELASTYCPDRLKDSDFRIPGVPLFYLEGWGYIFGPTFLPGSRAELIKWNPPTWHVPSDAELIAMERCIHDEKIKSGPMYALRHRPRLVFSAAAIAIDFIQHLPLWDQNQLRYIILDEQFHAISHPETHLQGLALICQPFPFLRVEARHGLWTTMLPNGNPFSKKGTSSYENSTISTHEALIPIVAWLDETTKLAASQASSNFTVIFDLGRLQLSWADIIIRAAVLQEVMIESYHRREVPLPLAEHMNTFYTRFGPLPCHLPASFPKAVKDIICRRSIVHCPQLATREVWDLEEELRHHEGFSIHDWACKWEELLKSKLNIPEGGWKPVLRRYKIPRTGLGRRTGELTPEEIDLI